MKEVIGKLTPITTKKQRGTFALEYIAKDSAGQLFRIRDECGKPRKIKRIGDG